MNDGNRMGRPFHICVCICTYRRPELLGRLLGRLERQETDELFDYSVVVVDNDHGETARVIVESFARRVKYPVQYCVEPEQNIAMARNRAVGNSRGSHVAFIDDDEYPDRAWLRNLLRAMLRYRPDGVLAPVLPAFDGKPPRWVVTGGFFDRPSHEAGHVLEWQNTRTGNALLKRALFPSDRTWFDPALGSGGEDRDFFRRQIEEGRTFVWCTDAAVYETVPPKRWERKVMLKRALLRGKMALQSADSRSLSILRSIAAIIVYTGCLPLFLVLGQDVFMKYLIRDCDHLGKVLALVHIDPVGERYVGG